MLEKLESLRNQNDFYIWLLTILFVVLNSVNPLRWENG